MPKFNERYFGFLGFVGFVAFTPGNSFFYMLFMLFFFFLAARPKTKDGTVQSDERWSANITKAGRNAFFVFLIPLMLSFTFLVGTDLFVLAVEVVPIIALLALVASFIYYDWRGD